MGPHHCTLIVDRSDRRQSGWSAGTHQAFDAFSRLGCSGSPTRS
jgi:hypothetical protein